MSAAAAAASVVAVAAAATAAAAADEDLAEGGRKEVGIGGIVSGPGDGDLLLLPVCAWPLYRSGSTGPVGPPVSPAVSGNGPCSAPLPPHCPPPLSPDIASLDTIASLDSIASLLFEVDNNTPPSPLLCEPAVWPAEAAAAEGPGTGTSPRLMVDGGVIRRWDGGLDPKVEAIGCSPLASWC